MLGLTLRLVPHIGSCVNHKTNSQINRATIFGMLFMFFVWFSFVCMIHKGFLESITLTSCNMQTGTEPCQIQPGAYCMSRSSSCCWIQPSWRPTTGTGREDVPPSASVCRFFRPRKREAMAEDAFSTPSPHLITITTQEVTSSTCHRHLPPTSRTW